MRDVSEVVKLQQNLSHHLYQDAVETNYSHEQMTPLNCILNNSKVILAKIKENTKPKVDKKNKKQHYIDLYKFNHKNNELTQQILDSAKLLYFYNSNQIEKMKIKKEQNEIKQVFEDSPENIIKEVLQPFQSQMETRSQTVQIIRDYRLNMSVRTDWRLYQLIIFNLIQNAVKYNKECGHLTIKINLSQKHRSTNPIGDIMFFETIIQDQGPGISQSRLKEMFNVFGELHQYQSMQLVKHNSIGVGLNCSKILTESLGGQINFIKTEPGDLSIKVSLPVKVLSSITDRKLSSKFEQVWNTKSGEKIKDQEEEDSFIHNLLGRKNPTQKVMSS